MVHIVEIFQLLIRLAGMALEKALLTLLDSDPG
jgi:hypothetical protein